VRSAFEESVGKRLQKYGGSDNKELLQRWNIVHFIDWELIIIFTTCVELVMKL
jgi:hypothetical protein